MLTLIQKMSGAILNGTILEKSSTSLNDKISVTTQKIQINQMSDALQTTNKK
ncbi:hypothetical protein IGL30_001047 [Enterococcus sp. DIV1089c]